MALKNHLRMAAHNPLILSHLCQVKSRFFAGVLYELQLVNVKQADVSCDDCLMRVYNPLYQSLLPLQGEL